MNGRWGKKALGTHGELGRGTRVADVCQSDSLAG